MNDKNPHIFEDDGEDDFYHPMLSSTLRYRKVMREYTIRDEDMKKRLEEQNDTVTE